MKFSLHNIGIVCLVVLLLAITFFYSFDIDNLLTIDFIKKHLIDFQKSIKNNFFLYFFYFFIIYLIIATFSLPVASFFSLFIGASFELLPALILISFASSIGACLSFMLSRLILKNLLEKKFKKYLFKINKGLQSDGLKYLFLLRMVPVIPFFLVNLLFGITNIKIVHYYLVSQIGMLPATLLYVNAGHQISKINNYTDIIDLSIVLSFVLIGVFPFLIKNLYTFISNRIKLRQ